MICPKCGGEMHAQVISEIQKRGILTVLLYIVLLFVPIIGWIALFMLLQGRKSKTVTYAVCQSCGYRSTPDEIQEDYPRPKKKYEKPEAIKTKEKIGKWLLVLSVALLATACMVIWLSSKTPKNDYEVAEQQDSKNEVADALEESKTEILDAAVSAGLPETATISLVAGRADLSVITEYSTEAKPDGWEDIIASVESAGDSLQSNFPEYTITIMYKDNAGNILLNVIGGDCKYDVFAIAEREEEKPGNPPTITMAEYNQIEMGMTYYRVCEIIGGTGTLLSETDLDIGYEYSTDMYSWDGEGSLGANANVTFQGGSVVSKAQFGLS